MHVCYSVQCRCGRLPVCVRRKLAHTFKSVTMTSLSYGSRMVPGKKIFYLAAATYYVATAT